MNMQVLAFQVVGLACCYFFLQLLMKVPLFRKEMRKVLRLSRVGAFRTGARGGARARRTGAGTPSAVVGRRRARSTGSRCGSRATASA